MQNTERPENKYITKEELELKRERDKAIYLANLEREQQEWEELLNNPKELANKISRLEFDRKKQKIGMYAFFACFLFATSFGLSCFESIRSENKVVNTKQASLCYMRIGYRYPENLYMLKTIDNKYINLGQSPDFIENKGITRLQYYLSGKNSYRETFVEHGGHQGCVLLKDLDVRVVYVMRVSTFLSAQYIPLELWFGQQQLVDHTHLKEIVRLDRVTLIIAFIICAPIILLLFYLRKSTKKILKQLRRA